MNKIINKIMNRIKKFNEASLDGVMAERKRRLMDLKDEIYNAEDVIDGAYNSKDEKYADLVAVNEKYDQLLVDMNELIKLLDDATGEKILD